MKSQFGGGDCGELLLPDLVRRRRCRYLHVDVTGLSGVARSVVSARGYLGLLTFLMFCDCVAEALN